MAVHVAIVSEQLLPTVIPCLMAKPDRVVLVASRAMAAKARRLKTLLRENGIEAEIREHAPDAGIGNIRVYARKLVDDLTASLAGEELVFNATGGTKLMTLGFVEVLRERAVRIIYTDTAHAQIEVIHDRRTADPQPQPMENVLDVPRYLAVQGFRYQGDASQDEACMARMAAHRPVAQYLAKQAPTLGPFIGTLNRLAHQALGNRSESLASPVQELGAAPRGRWGEALRKLGEAGLIRWSGRTQIRFPDVESTRFLGGGWLEEYAFCAARAEGLYDVRINVKGVWNEAETARNEFDVLACHSNRLLFMECKTHQWDEGPNDNDVAYKVESLGKDTRGVFGEIWVLTAREPTKILKDRATQGEFELIEPTVLSRLGMRVRAWKKGLSLRGRG